MHVRKTHQLSLWQLARQSSSRASMAHAQNVRLDRDNKSDVLHQISFKEFRLGQVPFSTASIESFRPGPGAIAKPGGHDHRGTKS